jgi:hypothetical protein
MAAAGMLELYDSEDQPYGVIPKWRDFQHLKNPRKSYLPAPPALKSVKRLKSVAVETGERRGEERKGGESNPSAPRADVKESPEAPPAPVIESISGGPEGNTEAKRCSGSPRCDPFVYGKNLLADESNYVRRAWGIVLQKVRTWGLTYPGTVDKLAARVEAAPARALAQVLDIAGNPKVTSEWGALNNLFKEVRWSPSDINQERAPVMIRGSPGSRNGVGTIGETLKDMGGET